MNLAERALAVLDNVRKMIEPPAPLAEKQRVVRDGLINVMSGLGMEGIDKGASSEWQLARLITKSEVETQYQNNWYANQIVRVPANDMVRAWVEHKGGGPDFATDMRDAERRLRVRATTWQSICYGRLYGGGGMILGVNPADADADELAEPFDVSKTSPDQLRYLRWVDRWRLSGTGDLDRDPQSPNFDNPEFYMLAGGDTGGYRIHHSRIIRFGGMPIPWQLWVQNARWDLSVLQVPQEAVQQLTFAVQAICSMIHEANFDVIGVEGLYEAVSAGNEDSIRQRFALANRVKSWLRAIVIDKSDTYESKSRTFSEIADVLEKLQINLCGAADVPFTRMFGQSPAGMNATGASDLEMYYSMIAAEQETVLRPKLDILFECLARSECGGYPDDYQFTFKPLGIERPLELSQAKFSQAQTDNIYMQAGVLQPNIVAKKLQSDGTYALTDEDIATIKELDEAPPPVPPGFGQPPIAPFGAKGGKPAPFAQNNKGVPQDKGADPQSADLAKAQQPNTKDGKKKKRLSREDDDLFDDPDEDEDREEDDEDYFDDGAMLEDYREDQPRDEQGRFAGGEGGSYGRLTASEKGNLIAHAHAGNEAARSALALSSRGFHKAARSVHAQLGTHESLKPKETPEQMNARLLAEHEAKHPPKPAQEKKRRQKEKPMSWEEIRAERDRIKSIREGAEGVPRFGAQSSEKNILTNTKSEATPKGMTNPEAKTPDVHAPSTHENSVKAENVKNESVNAKGTRAKK